MRSIIAKAIEKDPQFARSEWLCEWRSDLADYLSRDAGSTAASAVVSAIPVASDAGTASTGSPAASKRRPREIWALVGRGGGKDSVAFRESDLLRRLFETVLRRCIEEGLVGGEGFAVIHR